MQSSASADSPASGWRRFLQEPARPRRIADRPDAHWLVVATVCIGAFMGQLDASIVTLAFPTLTREFHVGIGIVQWVGLGYLLMLTIMLPLVGRLADMVGRKLLYTYGFSLFIIGSALCGLSPTIGLLISARVLQALGAAMLQANSVAIIVAAMPPDKLGRGIGVQGAAQAVGLALGPVVGGLLIATGGWQLIFYVNVPIGILGTVLGWYLIPRSRNLSRQTSFDWWGSALTVPAIGALFLALSLGNSLGWSSGEIIGLFALGCVAFAVFFVVERHARSPIVQLALMRERGFTLGIAKALGNYIVLFGMLFVAPFFLEGALGIGPARTGLELLAMPAALGLTAPLAGRLADRLGARIPIASGMLLAALALATLALVRGGTLGSFLAALTALGIGLGASISPNNASTVGSAPRAHAGVASGVLNMGRGIGTAMGLSVTGSVFEGVVGAGQNPALIASGFSVCMWMLAALALATAVIAILQGRIPVSGVDPVMTAE